MGGRLLALVGACALAAGGCGNVPRKLLPDLDQTAPIAVSLVERGGRRLLVFGAGVDNVGAGPLLVAGRRDGDLMRASQVVERSDGSRVERPTGAVMRFVRAETHRHWHLIGFERYELRRSGGALAGRSRKVGFCLGDRYRIPAGQAPGRGPATPPRWTGECGKGLPGLELLRAGISSGFGDDYPPEKEGQYVDVTGLPSGRYVLVHLANPGRELRESDYRNNAASVLLELDGDRLTVLARCRGSARCPR
jgi:hypothetical protein